MHGCEKERQKARTIGPHELTRCPNHYLTRPDAVRDIVINTFNDYKAGVIQNWPDGYAGAVVEGVRYIEREHNASTSTVLENQRRRNEKQAQPHAVSSGRRG
jgi:hypothetical protein